VVVAHRGLECRWPVRDDDFVFRFVLYVVSAAVVADTERVETLLGLGVHCHDGVDDDDDLDGDVGLCLNLAVRDSLYGSVAGDVGGGHLDELDRDGDVDLSCSALTQVAAAVEKVGVQVKK